MPCHAIPGWRGGGGDEGRHRKKASGGATLDSGSQWRIHARLPLTSVGFVTTLSGSPPRTYAASPFSDATWTDWPNRGGCCCCGSAAGPSDAVSSRSQSASKFNPMVGCAAVGHHIPPCHLIGCRSICCKWQRKPILRFMKKKKKKKLPKRETKTACPQATKAGPHSHGLISPPRRKCVMSISWLQQ